MSAADRLATLQGGLPAIWVGTADPLADSPSYQLVTGQTPELVTALDGWYPHPGALVVKFGADGGELWGTSDSRQALHWRRPTVVPYLFAPPAFAAQLPGMVQQLLVEGYPLVVLNLEESWDEDAGAFAQLLAQLDPEHVALCTYAWFGAMPHGGDLVNAAARAGVTYMPEAYLSELTAEDDPLAYMLGEIAARVDFDALGPVSYLLDTATLATHAELLAPATIAREPNADGAAGDHRVTAEPDRAIGGIWHLGTLTEAAWTAVVQAINPDALTRPSDPATLAQEAQDAHAQLTADVGAKNEALNTELGQSLEWLGSVDPASVDPTVADKIAAVIGSLHRARQYTGGELSPGASVTPAASAGGAA